VGGVEGQPVAAATFFISYTSADQAWAEWIAWQLEAAGYQTVLQAWDFTPGTDWVHSMHQAAATEERTIVVLSPAYLGSAYGEAEWRVAFANDLTGEKGLLLLVRVAEVTPPGLLRTRVYIDLVGLDEAAAAVALLAGVRGERGTPASEPVFPGMWAVADGPLPLFPGAGPAISNLALRNRNFTGRAKLLAAIEHKLAAGNAPAVVAVHGLGGWASRSSRWSTPTATPAIMT
jgi:hypothetical protein